MERQRFKNRYFMIPSLSLMHKQVYIQTQIANSVFLSDHLTPVSQIPENRCFSVFLRQNLKIHFILIHTQRKVNGAARVFGGGNMLLVNKRFLCLTFRTPSKSGGQRMFIFHFRGSNQCPQFVKTPVLWNTSPHKSGLPLNLSLKGRVQGPLPAIQNHPLFGPGNACIDNFPA